MIESTPDSDNPIFRAVIGILALGGALGGFFALFWIEIPARNENALLLALGFVMGWAGAVIASEYGSTTTGRRVADSAIRNIERQSQVPSGTPEDPLVVAGGAENSPPVDVKESKK